MFEPTAGRILLDGRPLREHSLASVRRSVGFVGQEAHLFSGTLLDNIALGDPRPDLDRAVAAAELADADGFIRKFPSGYRHAISEGGVGLSAGQRQRLALARALYRNPRILVLDEVTSFLDADSEATIEASLPRICGGRTTFIITHRLRSVVDCDAIFVMVGGRIVERGSHAALMAQNGLYARWQRVGSSTPGYVLHDGAVG
jgi:subfamily B ATP-binding cassette protein MsbA